MTSTPRVQPVEPVAVIPLGGFCEGGQAQAASTARPVPTHHRVNHDILIDRLRSRIADAGVIRLVRAYLSSGVLMNGIVVDRDQGTPQGGPLSPLLANVLLDEVDKELERRGHCFVRYADDANVYVRSRRAGERVMRLLRRLYARLRLRVNEAKSTIASVFRRKFLGYSFWVAAGGKIKRRVADKAIAAFKQRVRELTRRSGGYSLDKVVKQLRVAEVFPLLFDPTNIEISAASSM